MVPETKILLHIMFRHTAILPTIPDFRSSMTTQYIPTYQSLSNMYLCLMTEVSTAVANGSQANSQMDFSVYLKT